VNTSGIAAGSSWPDCASFTSSVNGLFVDSFTFTPAAVSGNVNVSLSALAGAPLTFFAAQLNESIFSAPGEGASAFSFAALVDASQPLMLTVFGFAGSLDDLSGVPASYSGNVTVGTVAAIPETSTYALMFGGLGLVMWVGAMRRRRQRDEF
jgi:hypothetical protein